MNQLWSQYQSDRIQDPDKGTRLLLYAVTSDVHYKLRSAQQPKQHSKRDVNNRDATEI